MVEDSLPSIFEFDSVGDYLKAVFEARKARRPSYSLRAWATKLGLKATDSGNISRILSGQRDLSPGLTKRFLADLQLQGNEVVYFELLALGKKKISEESLRRIRDCMILVGEPADSSAR